LRLNVRDPSARQGVTFAPEIRSESVSALVGFLDQPQAGAALEDPGFAATLRAADGDLVLELLFTASNQELRLVLAPGAARSLRDLAVAAVRWFAANRRDRKAATTLREPLGDVELRSYDWRARSPSPPGRSLRRVRGPSSCPAPSSSWSCHTYADHFLEIAAEVDVSQQAASQHLAVLGEAGLVEARKVGTRRVYAIKPDGFAPLAAFVESFWAPRLQALKDALDKKR
jgi:DNA-binding transcriptional ArsR family regulator